MAVNDVYKATIVFNAPNSAGEMQFSFHYRTVVVNTPLSRPDEAIDIAGNLGVVITNDYIPVLPEEITWLRTEVIGITDPTVGVTFSTNTPGTVVGRHTSLRVCPVVKLSTGLRGRSFNGRVYLMSPDESNLNQGVFNAGFVTALETFIDNAILIVAATSTNEYQMTIYSPTLTGTGPVVDNLVTGRTVNPKPGSQRSRMDVT